MQQELYEQLKRAVMVGDAPGLVALVEDALQHEDPLALVEQGMIPGMKEMGDQFADGEAFLPELLVAAEAMQAAMKIIKPRLLASGTSVRSRGTVVIGTVQTDIHEIGKSIVATLLTAAGFEVCDLGADVPTATFLQRAREQNADIIAASAIMTTTMPFQSELIQLLSAEGERERFRVMVGGGVVTRQWAEQIGADGYGELAGEAVEVALELVG